MTALRSFHNLSIRYKLLLSYSAVYILAIILGSAIIYSLVRTMIEVNIENVLKNSTATILAMVIGSLLLVLPLTSHIGAAITNPLQELMSRFAADTPGDFSARVDTQSRDELGQLASYFNLFMEKLEQYNEKLQGEILERKQAEKELRLSEEMFSKAFLP